MTLRKHQLGWPGPGAASQKRPERFRASHPRTSHSCTDEAPRPRPNVSPLSKGMWGRCPLKKQKTKMLSLEKKKKEILGNLVASQTARHFLLTLCGFCLLKNFKGSVIMTSRTICQWQSGEWMVMWRACSSNYWWKQQPVSDTFSKCTFSWFGFWLDELFLNLREKFPGYSSLFDSFFVAATGQVVLNVRP